MIFDKKSSTETIDNTAAEAEKTAADIMLDAVYTVGPQTPVCKAIASMLARRLTSVPVVDSDNQLLGILSEKDVLELIQDTDSDKHNVEDFMTKNVFCIKPETYLYDICRCFDKNSFRSVAVTDNGTLLSMINRLQVIRALAFKLGLEERSFSSAGRSGMFLAKDVMTAGLFTVKADDTIASAADLLIRRNVTALPVIDESMNLVGVVSEKDIISLLCRDSIDAQFVSEIMTADVQTFSPADSLFDICSCLRNNPFRRVIITRENKLVGILSRTDCIRFILTNRTAYIRHVSQTAQAN